MYSVKQNGAEVARIYLGVDVPTTATPTPQPEGRSFLDIRLPSLLGSAPAGSVNKTPGAGNATGPESASANSRGSGLPISTTALDITGAIIAMAAGYLLVIQRK